MRCLVFLTFFVFGCALAEIAIDELPIPNIDDLAVIKERCDTKGGEGTYEKVKEAKEKLQTCFTDKFNVTQIKIELDEASKTGSMDEVFGKYCRMRPEVKICVEDFTDTIKPCLDDTEKDALNLTLNVMEQLGEFACYRDGDRIAMFIAEGGIECLKDHTEGIQNCVNSTFDLQSAAIPTDTNSLPSLLIDREKCNDLGRLQTCVVAELEKCEESTPANVIDALFKFVKKQACKDTQRKRSIFKRSAVTDAVDTDQMSNLFLKTMKVRCDKYGTPNSYDNLETSWNENLNCLRRLHGGIAYTREQFKEKIEACMNNTLKYIKICLPEEEQYIPNFYLESTLAVADFVMDNKAKMQTRSFSYELLNCFQTYKQNPSYFDTLKECIKTDDDEDVNTLVTKELLCTKLDEVNTCVKESVEKVCVRDVEIQNFTRDFMASLASPCEDESVEAK